MQPVEQRHGSMSFVNTSRPDYLSRIDLSDAPTVMRQLPAAFEQFNEVHPTRP